MPLNYTILVCFIFSSPSVCADVLFWVTAAVVLDCPRDSCRARSHLLNLLPLHTILHLRGISGNKECGERRRIHFYSYCMTRASFWSRKGTNLCTHPGALSHSLSRGHITHSSALEPGDKTRFKLNPFPLSLLFMVWCDRLRRILALSMPVSTLPWDLSPAFRETLRLAIMVWPFHLVIMSILLYAPLDKRNGPDDQLEAIICVILVFDTKRPVCRANHLIHLNIWQNACRGFSLLMCWIYWCFHGGNC